ncbi:MAG: mechanosensitive ion channel [Magnetococcales bacterium]|nr:mechanosensitive ion channel [Magnetococcales bacterium]
MSLLHPLLFLVAWWWMMPAAQGVPAPSVAPLPVAPQAAAAAPVAPSSSLATLWETTLPTPAMLRALLETVTAELNGIPKESKEEGVEQHRALLQKRLALLQEFLETVERLQTLHAARNSGHAQEEALKKNLAQQLQQPPPKVPERPTPEAFKQVQDALEQASQAVEALTAQAKERQLLLSQIPAKIVASKERLQHAQVGHQQFQELANKAENPKKRLLSLQADNAHIEAQLAQVQGMRWEAEQEGAMGSVAVQDKQLEIAQARRQYQQKAFTLYQEALNNQQTEVANVRQEELQRKERTAQQATSPEQKFLTAQELEIARLKKNSADLNKLHTELMSAASEQEHLLQDEKEELKSLEALAKQFGTQGLAADILKDNFNRLGRRRWELREAPHPELLAQLTALQPRLFVMDAALAELNASWNTETLEIQNQLPAEQREPFAQQATALRNNYRQLLNEEKRLLFALQAGGQRLQLLTLERTATLNAMEGFLLARIFWIQDSPPLGMAVLRQLLHELFATARHDSLLNVWRQTVAPAQLSALREALGSPTALSVAFVLFFVLAPALLWLHGRLRRLQAQDNRLAKGEQQPPQPVRPETVGVALLIPTLGPLYVLVLLFAGHLLAFPATPLTPVLQQGALALAAFWFLWVANGQWLASNGWLTRLLRLPPDVSQSLAGSIEISLWAYLIFLPAWFLFRAPPFHYEALPRLGYTLFECAAAFALYRLIHPDAPLPRHAFAQPPADRASASAPPGKPPPPTWFNRHWRSISRLLTLFMAGVVLLDMGGYRFGADWLAYNGMRTVLTFFLLIGLYRLLSSTVERLIRRRRRSPTVLAPGTRETLTRNQIARQITASLRVLFILVGLVLVSGYWGIHEQTLQALKGWTIYSTTGNDGQLLMVTLVDFIQFFMTLWIVVWVVKHLPRLYELLLFSHWSLDAGSRYAVLTISRYLIFIIGLLSALNALHLDIAKIGWLVAAISVGIGFGLQEIVANFVSGIILLLERPVRVGDMITIGNSITGRITRINIRATTVLNTNYQEQLIPNRDLITKEVTNWTLASTTIRIVIPIGVAYGSDVGKVKALLLELAHQQPDIMQDPPPEVYFVNHGASSLDFELRLFLPDPALNWIVRDRINTGINRIFAEEQIEIPFPQQDIHIRTLPG